MENIYLRSTRLLNYKSKEIQRLIAERRWKELSGFECIRTMKSLNDSVLRCIYPDVHLTSYSPVQP